MRLIFDLLRSSRSHVTFLLALIFVGPCMEAVKAEELKFSNTSDRQLIDQLQDFGYCFPRESCELKNSSGFVYGLTHSVSDWRSLASGSDAKSSAYARIYLGKGTQRDISTVCSISGAVLLEDCSSTPAAGKPSIAALIIKIDIDGVESAYRIMKRLQAEYSSRKSGDEAIDLASLFNIHEGSMLINTCQVAMLKEYIILYSTTETLLGSKMDVVDLGQPAASNLAYLATLCASPRNYKYIRDLFNQLLVPEE